MINKLPKSLIETATKICIGHTHKLELPLGEDIFIGIRNINSILEESIKDWLNSVNIGNPHKYKELQDNHHKNLTEEEKKAVYAYTFNSVPIHDHILHSKEDEFNIRDSKGNVLHSGNISSLDSAIVKNNLPHDLITYAGVPSMDNNHGIVHQKFYTSTTVEPAIAHMFSLKHLNENGIYHILKIHNKKGDSGLYVGHNRELTETPMEFEYIIPRNSHFKIESTPEEVFDDNNNLSHKIWTAHRI